MNPNNYSQTDFIPSRLERSSTKKFAVPKPMADNPDKKYDLYNSFGFSTKEEIDLLKDGDLVGDRSD